MARQSLKNNIIIGKVGYEICKIISVFVDFLANKC